MWGPMRKGIAFLFRYQEVSAQSNARYLGALACIDDPTPAIRELDAITRAATTPNGRTARPFNPLSREDRTLFEVLLAGEYALHGFTNRDLRSKLGRTPFPLAKEPEKQPGQVTRLPMPVARPRADRQGPSLATLACVPQWTQADGQRHQAPRGRFPQALRPGRLTEELVCRTQRSDEGRIYGPNRREVWVRDIEVRWRPSPRPEAT